VSTCPVSAESLARDPDFVAASTVARQPAAAAENRNHAAPERRWPDIEELLAGIPQQTDDTGFGEDIDAVNRVLLDQETSIHEKEQRFRKWLGSRHQPCILGRLGAKDHQGISYDICWMDRATLAQGSPHVRSVVEAVALSHGCLDPARPRMEEFAASR
jgi:hypothetical protein